MFSNGDASSQFAVEMRNRSLPHEVTQAALMCLVDWFGVAVAGAAEGAASATSTVVASWHGKGRAPLIGGGETFPAAAALVNGTMAHCLDFDDIHHGSAAHLSAPTWAAVLAVGLDRDATPDQMIRAFIAGFEVAGRLGGKGIGRALNRRAIHSTGIIGCLAAAIAVSVLLELDQAGIQRALGAAATQVSGLTAAFGTMAKPFTAGKAAFNGVLAAELAQAGFEPPLDLFEETNALYAALIQDRGVQLAGIEFGGDWEILKNTFKPYASCLLTHPAIEAAQRLQGKIGDRKIERIVLSVNPTAIQIAGKSDPQSILEGKFSLAFCVALALSGIWPSQRAFTLARLADPSVRALTACVELVPEPDRPVSATRLDVILADGEAIGHENESCFGESVGANNWDDLELKFKDLMQPFGEDMQALFESLKTFDGATDLQPLRRAFAATCVARGRNG